MEKRLKAARKEAAEQFAAEKEQMHAEMSSLRQQLAAAETAAATQSQRLELRLSSALTERETAHARDIEAMQARVKELLAKKEEIIRGLKARVQETEETARRVKEDADAQRRELLEQINA